jgi:hypothetical protein
MPDRAAASAGSHRQEALPERAAHALQRSERQSPRALRGAETRRELVDALLLGLFRNLPVSQVRDQDLEEQLHLIPVRGFDGSRFRALVLVLVRHDVASDYE